MTHTVQRPAIPSPTGTSDHGPDLDGIVSVAAIAAGALLACLASDYAKLTRAPDAIALAQLGWVITLVATSVRFGVVGALAATGSALGLVAVTEPAIGRPAGLGLLAVTSGVAMLVALSSEERLHRRRLERDLATTEFSAMTRDGVVVRASPAWLVLLGIPPRETIGFDIAAFVHPDDRHHVLSARLARQLTGQCRPELVRMVRSDGQVLWVEWVTATDVEPGVEWHALVDATHLAGS